MKKKRPKKKKSKYFSKASTWNWNLILKKQNIDALISNCNLFWLFRKVQFDKRR